MVGQQNFIAIDITCCIDVELASLAKLVDYLRSCSFGPRCLYRIRMVAIDGPRLVETIMFAQNRERLPSALARNIVDWKAISILLRTALISVDEKDTKLKRTCNRSYGNCNTYPGRDTMCIYQREVY